MRDVPARDAVGALNSGGVEASEDSVGGRGELDAVGLENEGAAELDLVLRRERGVAIGAAGEGKATRAESDVLARVPEQPALRVGLVRIGRGCSDRRIPPDGRLTPSRVAARSRIG